MNVAFISHFIVNSDFLMVKTLMYMNILFEIQIVMTVFQSSFIPVRLGIHRNQK